MQRIVLGNCGKRLEGARNSGISPEWHVPPGGTGPTAKCQRMDINFCVAVRISDSFGILVNQIFATCEVGSNSWIKTFGGDMWKLEVWILCLLMGREGHDNAVGVTV